MRRLLTAMLAAAALMSAAFVSAACDDSGGPRGPDPQRSTAPATTFVVRPGLCDRIDLAPYPAPTGDELKRVSLDSLDGANPVPGWSACVVMPVRENRGLLLAESATVDQIADVRATLVVVIRVFPSGDAARVHFRSDLERRRAPRGDGQGTFDSEAGKLADGVRFVEQRVGLRRITATGLLGWSGNATVEVAHQQIESCGTPCDLSIAPGGAATSWPPAQPPDSFYPALRTTVEQALAATAA